MCCLRHLNRTVCEDKNGLNFVQLIRNSECICNRAVLCVNVFVVQLTRRSRGLMKIMFLRDLTSHMMLLLLNLVSVVTLHYVMVLTCTVKPVLHSHVT